MSDRSTRELCELFALGLLEGEVLDRFRARFDAGDPALLAELAAVENVVPLIGLTAPRARPAPELKRRLFSRIGADGFYFLLADEDGWNPTAEPGVHVRPLFIDPLDRKRQRIDPSDQRGNSANARKPSVGGDLASDL